MTKLTPIQEAMVAIAQSSDGGKNKAYAEAIVILRHLLPKEKEFISEVWDKGVNSGTSSVLVDGPVGWDGSKDAANKESFLSQYYPETKGVSNGK